MNYNTKQKMEVKRLTKEWQAKQKQGTHCTNCGKPCQDTYCDNKCYMGNDTSLEEVTK